MEISKEVKIITVSGLDGSGKSTQIEMLDNYLTCLGKKVFYFHAVRFSIAQKMTEIFNFCHPERSREISSKNNNAKKSVIKAGFFQIIMRRFFLIIDLVRFRMLCKKLRSLKYDFLLSDRYFYDTAVNINFLRHSDKKIRCEKFIKKPDLAIYLSADPEIIMRRERQPDQGIEYLMAKKNIFDKKFKEWDLKFIDGNRNKEVVFEEIKNHTENL